MPRPLGLLMIAASALAHDMHEVEHVHHHGLRCGTKEPKLDKHKHGRALAKGDCSATFTDPKPKYSPTNGPVYRINTCVHIIMSTDGETGPVSEACVSGGIAWLNRDFRATAGHKGSGSVDTRIEFLLIKTTTHRSDAWMGQDHGETGGFWEAATGECDVSSAANIFIKTPPGGILGQANLAAYADGLAPDGTTIGTMAWGPCATSSSYGLGATATHELGHYLGLHHTFNTDCQGSEGSYSGSCSAQTAPGCYAGRTPSTPGDAICDTNPQNCAVYDCASQGSCGHDEPVHNYMDYSHDSCLTQFTEEQARRMRCSLTSFRSGIFTTIADGYVAPVASPPPPAPPLGSVSPPPPSPPPPRCTCAPSWTYNSVVSSGCANPDSDANGNWCFSNEDAGCLLSAGQADGATPSNTEGGGAATASWFYCGAAVHSPPPPPSPPPSPMPPDASKCSCQASWTATVNGVALAAGGCANPDGDRGGAYCPSNEGRGCVKPGGQAATLSYFYCAACACAASWTHAGVAGEGCVNNMCVTTHGAGCILADGTQAASSYAVCTPPPPPPPTVVVPPSLPHAAPPPACPCPSYWLGDHECDAACNVAACNYDGGDCVASLRASPPPPGEVATCTCPNH